MKVIAKTQDNVYAIFEIGRDYVIAGYHPEVYGGLIEGEYCKLYRDEDGERLFYFNDTEFYLKQFFRTDNPLYCLE